MVIEISQVAYSALALHTIFIVIPTTLKTTRKNTDLEIKTLHSTPLVEIRTNMSSETPGWHIL